MDKFLREFFLETAAIYTLFGTKPMSSVLLISATEQERVESFLPHLQTLDVKNQAIFIQDLQEFSQNYDLDKNWEKWALWKNQQSCSPFLFSTRTIDDHYSSGYIINVQEVVWTLQRHYDVFCRELEMEFNPLNIVIEFEDPQSRFWNKVFDSQFLQGILYGYGERNSYFFSEQMNCNEERQKKLNQYLIFSSQLIVNAENRSEFCPLPTFRSYTTIGNDPVLVKYEKEREVILKELAGKNFTNAVLTRLFPS